LQGIHNKYIIDNIYDGNISITGGLTASNVNVSNLNILLNNVNSSNVYYTYSRLNEGIVEYLSTISSDNISEGASNLYYVSNNIDNIFNINISKITTDYIKEGTSNLYYTREYIENEINTLILLKTTDDLQEGTSNLYYTESRLISSLTNISTDMINEGSSNLYYTDNKVISLLSSLSSDNIKEGSSNLYCTSERINSQIDILYTASNINGVTVSGWDDSLNKNIGFKTLTPFYLGLYLSGDTTAGLNNISFIIPFSIDYNSTANTYNSSISTSNYWVSNFFIPPINGIYMIDYSIITDSQGITWINKGTDITSKGYNMLFNTQYISTANVPVSSSLHILAKTTDSWAFVYSPNTDSSIIYSNATGNNIGNTKASIMLIQEIM
jgi:hypothetical protein